MTKKRARVVKSSPVIEHFAQFACLRLKKSHFARLKRGEELNIAIRLGNLTVRSAGESFDSLQVEAKVLAARDGSVWLKLVRGDVAF